MGSLDWLANNSQYAGTRPYDVRKDPFAVFGFGLLVLTVIVFLLLVTITARRSAHDVFDMIRNDVRYRRLRNSTDESESAQPFMHARQSEEGAAGRTSMDIADPDNSGAAGQEAEPLVNSILKTHNKGSRNFSRKFKLRKDGLGKDVRFSSLVEEYTVESTNNLDDASDTWQNDGHKDGEFQPEYRGSMSERQFAEMYLH